MRAHHCPWLKMIQSGARYLMLCESEVARTQSHYQTPKCRRCRQDSTSSVVRASPDSSVVQMWLARCTIRRALRQTETIRSVLRMLFLVWRFPTTSPASNHWLSLGLKTKLATQ